MMKYKKAVLCVCVTAIAILGAVLLFTGKDRTPADYTQPENETRAPENYTWEEYHAMSFEEQDAFFERFESIEAFEAWKESVKPDENPAIDLHWDKPGKLPDAYTWEEYQALSLEEQDSFFRWFPAESVFEEWLESVKPTEPSIPGWNKPGKLPEEYTWEEYQALSMEEQESFFLWFASESDFQAWKDSAKPVETEPPVQKWDKTEKLPKEYTWEEYQALEPEEQERFFQWFGSVSSFEKWMKKVKPKETEVPAMGWDKPGKKPNEYTWEEYQALSAEEQEGFYLWFKSKSSFEKWMKSAQEQEASVQTNWNKSGKKPDEYTWAEYQALSPEEQDAFFNWFGSVEAFEAWMKTAKPADTLPETSWDKTGKTPDQYTWEEYQALNPADQERFYQWFASIDAFEAWMESAEAEASAAGKTWNKPGKKPDQYTKEEYLALNTAEREAFFQWFETLEAFEAWVSQAENS